MGMVCVGSVVTVAAVAVEEDMEVRCVSVIKNVIPDTMHLSFDSTNISV